MVSWRKWLIFVAWGAGAVLLLMLVVMLFLCGTDSGRARLVRLIAAASDGEVNLEGLGGGVPGHISVRELRLRDKNGVWVHAQNVVLDWNVFALLTHSVDINNLYASRVDVQRKPAHRHGGTSSRWHIRIAQMQVDRLHLAQPLLGYNAVLSVRGRLNYVSRDNLDTKLTIRRLDQAGLYHADLSWRDGLLNGAADVTENGRGLIGDLAGLPDLGPVNMVLRGSLLDGHNDVRFNLSAGAARAQLHSRMRLTDQYLDADFSVSAPAMRPRRDFGWAGVDGTGHIGGTRDKPVIRAVLTIATPQAGRLSARSIRLRASGSGGSVAVQGVADGMALPRDNGVLAAPLTFTVSADLLAEDRTLTISASHPLLRVSGTLPWDLSEGRLRLRLPDLAAIRGITGVNAAGYAETTLDFSRYAGKTDAVLEGDVAVRGTDVLPRLVGKSALHIHARVDGDDLRVDGTLNGGALNADIRGKTKNGEHDYALKMRLRDIALLSPHLTGAVSADATLTGTDRLLALNGDIYGVAGLKGFAGDRMALHVAATGRPGQMRAALTLNGRLAHAPVMGRGSVVQAGGRVALQLAQLSWQSVSAHGGATFGGGQAKSATADISVGALSDLTALLHTPMKGRADAHLSLGGNDGAAVYTLNASSQDGMAGGTGFGDLQLQAQYRPDTDVIAATLQAAHVAHGGVTGTVTAKANGALRALQTELSSRMVSAAGPVRVDSQAEVSVPGRTVLVRRLTGDWAGQKITLVSPARLGIRDGVLRLDVKMAGTASRISAQGAIPLDAAHSFDLTVSGSGNLKGWTAPLSADGRILLGAFDFSAVVRGPAIRPDVRGHFTIKNGRFHDFTSGISLSALSLDAVADGPAITVRSLAAKAGSGRIEGNGRIDTAGAMPLFLNLRAHKAEPFHRDGLAVTIDGAVQLGGQLRGGLLASGDITVRKGELRLPDKLSDSLAVLKVRRKTDKAQPRPAFNATQGDGRIALALRLTSPGQFFVRGRGVDAELEGNLTVTGTTAAPQIGGALTLRQGTYSLAGTTLDFQSGSIRFVRGETNRINPALDFTAEATANSVTATLKVTGTASAPQIALSSSPSLPQDEILSQLLFQQSVQQLSPFQMASIAQGVAGLSGIGGDGFDPVGLVRRNLKLDKLALGSSGSGSESSTTVEAGKYVGRGVYVGAKQDLSGGTRAIVQLDITRRLKLQASVAAGTRANATTSTQSQDNGDTVGLTYQFEY